MSTDDLTPAEAAAATAIRNIIGMAAPVKMIREAAVAALAAAADSVVPDPHVDFCSCSHGTSRHALMGPHPCVDCRCEAFELGDPAPNPGSATKTLVVTADCTASVTETWYFEVPADFDVIDGIDLDISMLMMTDGIRFRSVDNEVYDESDRIVTGFTFE